MSREPRFWILDGAGEPRRVVGVEAWMQGMLAMRGLRTVGRTPVGDRIVSTVFIGSPQRWETALVGRRGGVVLVGRCNGAREQAEAMHAEHVRRAAEAVEASNPTFPLNETQQHE